MESCGGDIVSYKSKSVGRDFIFKNFEMTRRWAFVVLGVVELLTMLKAQRVALELVMVGVITLFLLVEVFLVHLSFPIEAKMAYSKGFKFFSKIYSKLKLFL